MLLFIPCSKHRTSYYSIAKPLNVGMGTGRCGTKLVTKLSGLGLLLWYVRSNLPISGEG